jgi:hypothetical protein
MQYRGMGDQPLSLSTKLQTQLSRLLEERKRLLESANQRKALKQDHEKLFRRLAYLERLAELAKQLQQKKEVKIYHWCAEPWAPCYIYYIRKGRNWTHYWGMIHL